MGNGPSIPGFNQPTSLKLWSRRGQLALEEAVKEADVILSVISMKGVAELGKRLEKIGIPKQAIITTATKPEFGLSTVR